MMKPIILALSFIFGLGGCTSISDPALMDRVATLKYADATHTRPSDWERQAITNYHATDATVRHNMTQQQFRDSVIYRELAADDDDFEQFARNLRSERAGGNISGDLATTILNGLGAVTGGAATKSTLAVLAGGMTSARGSVEKELFNLEALSAILARMRAARLQALVPIQAGLAQSIGDYPLERALFDLRGYANAGTLSGTLAAIANDAGEEAQDARNDLQDIQRVTRGADYRASFDQRSAISGRIRNLTDAQVLSAASKMLIHFADRPQAVQQRITARFSAASRVANAQNAKQFLLYWIEQESSPDQLRQWTETLDETEKE